jgi:ArsR family metal-binding transcriptional regulator
MKAIFKKYERIQSIYGEINLDMEDINAAASGKTEQLEKFRSKAAFRANNKRWYVG